MRTYEFTCPLCHRQFTARQWTFLWWSGVLRGTHICTVAGTVFTIRMGRS